jgi:site-specific DNA-methyltransferase (adenine-specific)
MTTHSLVENDCRNLSFIPDSSVNLIITHPPALGAFGESCVPGQFSAILDYGDYLTELDSVWSECDRVLAPGGHLACVASPVARCDADLPLAADIHARTRRLGLDVTRAIRWFPQDRVELDNAAFYGAQNQPCGELLCDSQDVLVMRKPGERLVSVETQVSSRMPADYFAASSSSVWLIPAEMDPRHPHSFPVELAERLIRMFSYAGDTVLDPFAGIGTTSAAARAWGRNSIAVEIERRYFDSMAERMSSAGWPDGEITITRGPFLPDANRTPVALPAV